LVHTWPAPHEALELHLAVQVPAVHTCVVAQSASPVQATGKFASGGFGNGVPPATTDGGGLEGLLGAQKFGLPTTQVESAAQSASE
jgi:hypothetical protein